MKHLAIALAILLAAAPVASADALERDRIPAGVSWLAHLDVRSLRETELGEHLWRELGRKNGLISADEWLTRVRRAYGLVLFDDLHSLTLYGAGEGGGERVALIVASSKVESAVRRVQRRKGYRADDETGIELHVWESEVESAEGTRSVTTYAYLHPSGERDERTVLLSDSRDAILRGARVLLGKGPSLGAAEAPEHAVEPRAATFLFLSASKGLAGLSPLQPASQVARMAGSIILELSEEEGIVHANMVVEAQSEGDAQRMASILNGALALAREAGGNQGTAAALNNLSESLSVLPQGGAVVFEVQVDALGLVELVKDVRRAQIEEVETGSQ